MRYISNILFIAILLAFTSTLSGQNIQKARKMFTAYEYAEVIPKLKKIIDRNKKGREEAVVMLADCYRFINDHENAASYYAMAMEQQELDPMVHFYYGQTLRTLERYEESKEQFLKFSELRPEDERGRLLADNCNVVMEWQAYPVKHEPENVSSLNSRYADFSPVFYLQGVVITTERPEGGSAEATYEWTGNPHLKLMFSRLNGMVTPKELIYSEPELLDGTVNQPYHDGTAAFSPDGSTMFFTRTQQERVPKDEDRFKTYMLKMYYVSRDGEEWSKPKPFFLNSDEYSVGHPAFSPDGNSLYFVSDMPGGSGGTDIWMCEREDESWSHAINLGPEINTLMDEMFPHIDEGGTLYFASEGHPGFGGLDLFYASMGEDGWGKVTNLMKDVNSSYDDFGLSLNHGMGTGLFSSNRPGGLGSDDIYAFEIGVKMMEICGKVVDPDKIPLANASVFFLDKARNEVLVLKTDENGEYCTSVEANTDYTILGKKSSYMDDCTHLIIKEDAVDPEVLILAPYEIDQVFTIENIYYDLDKWYIRPDAEPALDNLVKIMKEHPISIELGSHTDCRASDEYNIELSQKRAEAAIRYLVLNGINSARMTAKGYGETKLVNECADGVDCTEEQHQENRRTEFRITGIGEYSSEWTIEEIYKEGDIIPLSSFKKDFFEACVEPVPAGKY
jgi:outer membrane protein OmpA-like peptidoglycan-associated protein